MSRLYRTQGLDQLGPVRPISVWDSEEFRRKSSEHHRGVPQSISARCAKSAASRKLKITLPIVTLSDLDGEGEV